MAAGDRFSRDAAQRGDKHRRPPFRVSLSSIGRRMWAPIINQKFSVGFDGPSSKTHRERSVRMCRGHAGAAASITRVRSLRPRGPAPAHAHLSSNETNRLINWLLHHNGRLCHNFRTTHGTQQTRAVLINASSQPHHNNRDRLVGTGKTQHGLRNNRQGLGDIRHGLGNIRHGLVLTDGVEAGVGLEREVCVEHR